VIEVVVERSVYAISREWVNSLHETEGTYYLTKVVLEVSELQMLTVVTIIGVRIANAVNLRFLGTGSSVRG